MAVEWPIKTLAECASLEPYSTQIGPFGKALMADEYTESGVPVLRGVNVNRGRFHDDDFVFIHEDTADRLRKFESHPGDVLLVHKGTLGQIGLMPSRRKYRRYIADGVESNKFEFRKNEILFGKLRPYFHKVGVAPADGVCSTDIVVVRPCSEEWFGCVLGHVSSTSFVAHTNAGSTGTKMPRTSWNEMARYPIVLPTEAIAKAFTEKIRPIVARILASIHQTRTLTALRDTVLPKLVSGALRIKDAEGVASRMGA